MEMDNTTIKISVLIPVKGREEVTNVTIPHWHDQVSRAEAFNIELTLEWIKRQEALSDKLNRAVMKLPTQDYDYLMIMGSDDLVRPQIWGYIALAINEGYKFFGFNEAVLYDRILHQAKLWKAGAYTFGAGRCVSKKIVMECGRKLWDDGLENGIDRNQEGKVLRITGEPCHIIPTFKPVICDIKDGDNINSYDSIEGYGLNAELIRDEFPDLNAFVQKVNI